MSLSNTYYRRGVASFYNPEEAPSAVVATTEGTTINSSEMSTSQQTRRYTTITLKEIRYPLGCPCHPVDPELARKQAGQCLNRRSSMEYLTGLYQPHARPQLIDRSESQESTSSQAQVQERSSLTRFFRRTPS